MSRLAWVKVVLRLIGLMFIGLAAPETVQFVGQILAQFEPSQQQFSIASNGWGVMYALGWGFGYLAQLALGIYLLVYGKGVRAWCISAADGTCPRCDYECGGAETCPECGFVSRPAVRLPDQSNAGPSSSKPSDAGNT